MGAGHDHGTGSIRHERPLWWALALTCLFLVVEVIGGLMTNSLALLSDAAHMATDVVALAISLVAVRLSRRPADARRTYGYARMEAIGAMVNGGLLFLVAGYIFLEALGRFRNPADVAATGMLVIASLGLVINLIAMRLLKAGSDDNLNMKGAYLEVWSDMLGSVGVIIGAIVIKVGGWTIADPIIAVLIALWVLPRTWTLLCEASQVLMEGVPRGVDLQAIREAIASHPGVVGLHDLHVWALGSNKPIMTAHIVVDETSPMGLRADLATMLDQRFGIEHATLQLESAADADHGQHATHE